MATATAPPPVDARSDEERERVENDVAAKRGHDTEERPLDRDLVITGSGQLGFDVGGKEPTGSSLRLTGGKIKVSASSFEKGESLTVEVKHADGETIGRYVAVVDEVSFKDETDSKTGQVIGCERRHKARIAGVAT